MRYAKKRTIIKALRFACTPEGMQELNKFCAGKQIVFNKDAHPNAIGFAHISIPGSLSSGYLVVEGDWVIKDGINLDICKHDMFNALYEAVYD
ncbi:MAG: hypothetical protein ACXWTU_00475 [Methylotenera sp.]